MAHSSKTLITNKRKKFKQTEIGIIPEDWTIKELDELVKTKTGKWAKRQPKGNFPIIGSNGILGYTDKFLEHEDLIFTGRVGTIGRINFLEKRKVWLSDNVLYSKAKDTELLKYVYYFLKKSNFSYLNVGGVQPLIKQSDFKKLKIALPQNPQEISLIINFLSALDSEITLNNKMNNTLEDIVQTLFHHWFVDYEFPDKNGRPYKSSGGKMIHSDELQESIPKGWKTLELGSHVNVINGCSYKGTDLTKSRTALVTLKSINVGGGFNQNGYKEFVGNYKTNQVVNDGEIVIAITDLMQEAKVIGQPAVINSLDKYSILVASLDLQIVRPNQDLSKNYLYCLLKTNRFHNHALSHTNGTTVLHLDKNALAIFLVAIPSKSLMNKFDNIAKLIFEKIIINEYENRNLTCIRDLLLPKLILGRLQVPAS